MRPGHIKVFDGLRITTEHVEHLQGSLHSALHDIREILGLGKVYSGFEVVAEGNQTITVQPGLAFDFQKNRIVCDEPKTLAVTFGPDDETQYVCIKYDQVEDGQVEGQFTLIWDSCAMVLRSTLPEPKENLIPIARLAKSADGEKPFEIIRLPELAPEPGVETETMASPDEEAVMESENGEVSEEIVSDLETPEESAETFVMEEKSETENISEMPTSKRGAWCLRVRQGVARLSSDSGSSNYLSTTLVDALQKKLSGKTNFPNGEFLLTLAEKEIALDFPVSSLTCRTIISGAFTLAEVNAAASPATGGKLDFQATAEGEATLTNGEIAQFGVAKMPYFPSSGGSGGMPWWTAELTERGMAFLPFGTLARNAENERLAAVQDILPNLQLLVRVDKTASAGFKIICNLLWKGEITEEIIRKMATPKPSLTWETLLAWKALGE